MITQAYSQKESANWFFGEKAALSFNSDSPVSIANSSLVTHEGSATISDSQGHLLFYTDGVTIWDKRNRVMPNGNGLFGNKSSTMSALIIPKPGTINRYYVFTIDEPGKSKENFDDGEINGVNYSEVDMTLNSGYGDVILKNQPLITYDVNNDTERYFKSSEKITAVTHDDEISIWVITHLGDTFYSFLIDESGVNQNPVTSTVSTNIPPRINSDSINVTAIGYLKVSPNGKSIAIAHSSSALGSPKTGTKKSGKIFLYDFDNINGTVNNEKLVRNGNYPYGVEFSPNSKLLYATVGNYDESDVFTEGYLYQYNVKSSDIPGSEVLINTSNYYAGALQLAIDGKIYRAGYTGTAGLKTLSYIDKPNNLGASFSYQHGKIKMSHGLAKLGLPPFVQSIFKYRFDYTYTCAGAGFEATFNILPDPSEEDPDYKMSWDFGDGETSSSRAHHYYAVPGDYEVSMELVINDEIQTYKKTITIAEEPTLGNDYELIVCDAFDADANDGLTYFNLQSLSANNTIFTSDLVQVYFYKTSADAAVADKFDAINSSFETSVKDQIVYANVYANNSDCFQTVEVKLATKDPIPVGEFNLKACQTVTESIANFDLSDTFKSKIRSKSGFSNTVSISFYESREDAQNGENPISENYDSSNTIVYIKAESNEACYDVGKVNLEVNYFPILKDRVYNVCVSEFPITIDSGLKRTLNDNASFAYSWDGPGTSKNEGQSKNDELKVFEAGDYYVTIYDEILDCSNTLKVSVKEFPTPLLKDYKVDDYNLTIHLDNASEDFEYSVDYLNGFQDSNVFRDLSAGKHILYVRDKFRCNLIEETFYVFGLPKYFTPNGDGIHDRWKVEGLDPNIFTKPIDVYVFDRYGKIMTRFDALNSDGWDGTLSGAKLLPNDYWYYLVLPNGKEYRGHFTLKN